MANYVTADELRGIAAACEQLQPLWRLLTNGPKEGVSFDMDNDAPHVLCYDANGDTLGFISWGEGGPAFYIKPEEVEEAPGYDRKSFPVDLPCPDCGHMTILGWYFQGEKGEHQHTYYNCTFWETGHAEGSSGDTGRCGWHGWTVPTVPEW